MWSGILAVALAFAAPDDARTAAEIDRVERWALYGVFVPIGAAAALSIATNPSENDVPTPLLATMGGLWALGGTWGTSLGYFHAKRPVYAALTGVSKSVLLAGALLGDRALSRDADGDGPQEEGHGFPFLTVFAIVGIVAWDVYDYWHLEDAVREDAGPRLGLRVAPVIAGGAGAGMLGLAGHF